MTTELRSVYTREAAAEEIKCQELQELLNVIQNDKDSITQHNAELLQTASQRECIGYEIKSIEYYQKVAESKLGLGIEIFQNNFPKLAKEIIESHASSNKYNTSDSHSIDNQIIISTKELIDACKNKVKGTGYFFMLEVLDLYDNENLTAYFDNYLNSLIKNDYSLN